MRKLLLGLIGLLFAVPAVAATLPAEYQELESITFPGGTYIKTGITPKTFDYEVGFKGAFGRTTSGPNCAWGFMSGAAGLVPRWISATYQDGYILNANTTSSFGDADTNTHTFVGRVYEKNGTPYWSSELDGVIKQNDQTLRNTAEWEANTLEIYLGARNNNGRVSDYGLITANHWWCKKAGVMIADYIPAKRNSDNVVGMFDTVSGEFLTNAGTGEFIAGPVIPEAQIKIATTAYNSARFSPVVTELNDTIATIRSVVTNTINQTKAIADLQATKQTRPNENCPAGKKCLLVEDNDGTPHWFEIVESAD